MYTLLLDTSGPYTTVLLVQDLQLVTSSIVEDRPAEHLHEQIQTSLDRAGLLPSHLNQIAVVIGPGSWTGLNIGVTTAKTLAQVLQIPVCPIRTLDALTESSRLPAWGIMSAGRDRCYYARHTHSKTPEMDVASIDDILQLIEADQETASIYEYGDTFSERFCDHPHYHTTDRLLPESLILASKNGAILKGNSIHSLVPAYLQPSYVERDASR